MKLTCPACGALMSLEMVINDEAARNALGDALALPSSLRTLVVRYLALHRPAKSRLSWSKVSRLLNELNSGVQNGAIQRDGKTISAPVKVWEDALKRVVNAAETGNLNTPLNGHGYLYSVIAGRKDQREAVAEAQHIEKQRNRTRDSKAGQYTSKESAAEAVKKLRQAAAGQAPRTPSKE